MKVAARLNVEFQVVVDALVAILSTGARFLRNESLSLDGIVPLILRNTLVSSIGLSLGDTISASNRVGDLDLSRALLGLKLDSNLLRRSAAELEVVVLASQDSRREARHALLASVEGIPDVVHHGVELVLETGLFVAQIYRLDCAIPAIGI